MLNGKVGKRAMVVKSDIPGSKNLGKVFTCIRLANPAEKQDLFHRKDEVWLTDGTFYIYKFNLDGNAYVLDTKMSDAIPDHQIKLLPELPEEDDMQEITEKEKVCCT